MTPVERPHEGNLAWELVDQTRDILTGDERHVVFVHLGVEDYPPAIRCVLNAVAREGMPLSANTLARLRGWAEAYDRHRDFDALLAQVSGGSDSMDETG